jgi:hypothetical protein
MGLLGGGEEARKKNLEVKKSYRGGRGEITNAGTSRKSLNQKPGTCIVRNLKNKREFFWA